MFRDYKNIRNEFLFEKTQYKGLGRIIKNVVTFGGSEQKRAARKQARAMEEQARAEAEMFERQMAEETKRRREEQARAREEARRAREEQAKLIEEDRKQREAEASYNRQLSQDTGSLAQANINAINKPQTTGNASKIDYSGSLDKRFEKDDDEEEKEKLRKAFRVR